MKTSFLQKNNKVYIFLVLFIALLGCKNKLANNTNRENDSSRVEYLPYYNEESFTPKWIIPNTKEEKIFHKIPEFTLINQLSDTITNKTFKNKIYITDFFFATCPGICAQMTSNMFKLQNEFIDDPDVLFLSHSVTPTKDSVPVLKNYAKINGVIDNKWHLVTGNKAEIYKLGRDHYFVENDMGNPKTLEDFLHTENFLLIDKNKHIRGIYNGLNRASMQQLIIDIKTLKKEN